MDANVPVKRQPSGYNASGAPLINLDALPDDWKIFPWNKFPAFSISERAGRQTSWISNLSVAGSMEGISAMPNETFTQLSAAGKRILWTLNSPLESAIQVAPNQYYEPGAAMEPYFRPAAADLAPSWHPVSQESLMEPQVPAVIVRIACIDSWAQLWVDLHRDCLDTNNDHQRPRAKDTQLEVTAGGAFLTAHEYVSAVHPWLMGMREMLLDVLGKLMGSQSWAPESKLAVLYLGPGPLRIGNEDEWANWHKKPTPRVVVDVSKAANEERSQGVMERMLARSAARTRELERIGQGNN
ncbi:hypothetical protein S40285_10690 [Stachybotrys chlorohalonatus IBT 40285]|uniref:Uncharacterized protein n=1 Tax=Stachybotrys chlorohalonatus (strain IBT 40285) TaxID=1283841 RepID=A0A084QYG9_STAC4|nr:hypothetical protein S40285_10690 [Stachybotrys chlorohalonata IBT 40285]